ncbi:restriction endonuclease subunit S [Lactococcus lactis]|uniref:Restriction endonuclease subunit S n=1 Tax=Lactococcus lactis TaxID=1358 RepID=A0A9X4S615_9LACT|nr:restriction endonuclease subunit S [Lactococcus lactis]MDG4984787.1 restriction endonuclease subunit S [Lactococcus lactis]
MIDQNEFFNKTIASRDVSGYYLIKNGEFAYNKSYSNGYPWGAVKRLNRYNMGVLSTLYIVFKPTNIDSDFLEKYYDTTYWHKEISKHAAEGARNHGLLNIAATDFFKTELVISKSLEEQQKIGAFFKQLDDTITLHQRKLDKLKRLKQGYLQQLFPKNDEKVPRVRFANFENKWEQRKLGEISRMYQPLTITGNDLLPDGVPVFGANGFIGFFSEANHIDDQVTISARGEGTGTPSYVHGPVWVTGNSMVVNVGDFDIDKYFLFANLTANSLKKYVTGGAQPQLTRDVLVKVPITLPNTDEQEKIGSFFKQLDETITLHHSKLDKLNILKQALLQKMFI